jgi:mccF-like protein
MKCRKITIGSTLGIMCPSSRQTNEKQVELFLKYLSNNGFKYKLGQSMYAKCGYLAGSDTLRAEDFNHFIQDDEIDAILCFKGGYGASRFLHLIDYEQIKKHPKLIVGFSDVTVLLNAIYQKTGLPTLHGEMGVVFKESFLNEKEFSFTNLVDTLLGIASKNLLECENNAIFQGKDSVEGEIVGGNLSLVVALMGTPYEIDTKGKILLLEDVGERPYRIDSFLSTLKLSGKLDDAKGIIFGYFTDCEKSDEDTQSVEDVLNDYTKDLKKTIIYHFPTGHSRPFVNVPIGLRVRINPTDKSVIVLESLFFDK